MKWCKQANMWISDMDDEDIAMIGCNGECNICSYCEDCNFKW